MKWSVYSSKNSLISLFLHFKCEVFTSLLYSRILFNNRSGIYFSLLNLVHLTRYLAILLGNIYKCVYNHKKTLFKANSFYSDLIEVKAPHSNQLSSIIIVFTTGVVQQSVVSRISVANFGD